MRINVDVRLKKLVLRGIGVVFAILGIIVFIKYLLLPLLPFVLAYLISVGIRPISKLISAKIHIPERACSVAFIILLVVALSFLLWFLGSVLEREVKEAAVFVTKALSDEKSSVRKTVERIMESFRGFEMAGGEISIDTGEMISGALSQLAATLGGWLKALVKGAPAFFLSVVVTVVSVFYFSCDINGVERELCRFLPKRVTEKGREWIGIAIRALKRFFKAYLSLLGITFLALAVGYFIVGVDYPLLAALLTSLVDILPVFGVGTVLLPWSAVMLVSGETGKGIGLAVLFLIIYAMRQVIEPRIVGKNAGVHPLLVLLFVFLGLQLFGVVGMIAAPVLLNGAAVFWEEKKKNSPAEVDKEEGSGYNYIE